MKKFFRFWKVVIFDTIGILLMILALLTGWLPGPGGIPLFIIGLGILAIHHEWAQKYIDGLKDWVDKFGKRIFTEDKRMQLAYDIVSPLAVIGGIFVLYIHNALWQITVGIFLLIAGLTLFAGNRKRFQRLKAKLKN
jgi:uncharacterized membrane protein YfcA